MTTAALGSLFRFIRNGMNVKQDKSGDGLPITRIETISDALVDPTRVGYAALSEHDADGWLLEPGDILFSHINSVSHIGKCAIYRGQPPKLVHGMNLLCLRSDPTKLFPEFAKYLVRSGQFRARLANCVKKAVNQASVSIGDLQGIAVEVPTLSEQRRIAEILDKADTLRAKRRAALAQLDTLTQSIFLDMFGDPATNPKGWDVDPLLTLGRVTTGSTPPSAKEGMFNGPIPFVTPGDLESDQPVKRTVTEDGASESRTVGPGAMLVCCIGATIGKMGKANTRSAFNQQINAVEWGAKVNPDFGLAVMRFFKPTIVARGASTTLPILKKSAFERINIPVPPMQEQREFAVRVVAVGGLRVAQSASGADFDTLFASLQHRAFRGEL